MPRTAPSMRIVGVDTARGLAVLGMFVAHLGLVRHTEVFSSTGWFFLADGRPSALFAMLAGVGLVFMTRGALDDRRAAAVQRHRIVLRSIALYLLGYGLILLGTPIAIILPSYALLFVMAIPFLRLRAGTLLLIAGVVFLLMPQVLILSRHAVYGAATPSSSFSLLPGIAEIWGGYYPAMTWLGYVLVGVAIGRMDLRRRRTQVGLAGIGGAVAALAYGLGSALETVVIGGRGTLPFDLVTIEDHANTTPEMVGNVAFAVAVVGLCLLATSLRAVHLILYPVSAAGAMSLSVYSLHIVYIAVLGQDAVWNPESNWPLIWLVLASLLFAVLWRQLLGQGPLERMLRGVITPLVTDPESRPPGPPAGPGQRPDSARPPPPHNT